MLVLLGSTWKAVGAQHQLCVVGAGMDGWMWSGALPSSDLNDTAPEYALVQLHRRLHRALLLKLDVCIPSRNREQSTGDAASARDSSIPPPPGHSQPPQGTINPCLCKHSSHALPSFFFFKGSKSSVPTVSQDAPSTDPLGCPENLSQRMVTRLIRPQLLK